MQIANDKLLREHRALGRCEWCPNPAPVQVHHLRSVGAGRLDIRVNICNLCACCHTEAHAGNIMRCDLLAVVASREKVLQSDIERLVNLLRRLIKPTPARLREELAGLPRSTWDLAMRELAEAGIMEAV